MYKSDLQAFFIQEAIRYNTRASVSAREIPPFFNAFASRSFSWERLVLGSRHTRPPINSSSIFFSENKTKECLAAQLANFRTCVTVKLQSGVEGAFLEAKLKVRHPFSWDYFPLHFLGDQAKVFKPGETFQSAFWCHLCQLRHALDFATNWNH